MRVYSPVVWYQGGLPAGSVPYQFTLCEPCLNLLPLFNRHQGAVLQITGTKKLPGINYSLQTSCLLQASLRSTSSNLNVLTYVQYSNKVNVDDLSTDSTVWIIAYNTWGFITPRYWISFLWHLRHPMVTLMQCTLLSYSLWTKSPFFFKTTVIFNLLVWISRKCIYKYSVHEMTPVSHLKSIKRWKYRSFHTLFSTSQISCIVENLVFHCTCTPLHNCRPLPTFL